MKLDIELLKLLMIVAEGEESPDTSRYTKEQILYHRNKLLDVGWAEGQTLRGNDKIQEVAITDLTFAGHQTLGVMRNDTAWNKVKAAVQKHGATLTISILQAAITQVASGLFP